MSADPSADGDSKEMETVPARLLIETSRHFCARRMASQSPSVFGTSSLPNRRLIQDNFTFPVDGSNRFPRVIDQRSCFLKIRAVRSLLLKSVSSSSTVDGPPTSMPRNASAPKAELFFPSSTAG